MNVKTDKVYYKEISFPPHNHDTYEMIFYLKGCGTISIAGEEHAVKRGTCVIVPPKCFHTSRSIDSLESIYVNGDFGGIFNFTDPVIFEDNEREEGAALMSILYNNRFTNREYFNFLCNSICCYALQNLSIGDGIKRAVTAIVDEIYSKFHDSDFDVAMALEKSGYAEDYIRAQFKNINGKTPVAFLTEVRMTHACTLMEIYGSAISLSEISEMCGYVDYTYFSRKFKQLMGVSPREFRESL